MSIIETIRCPNCGSLAERHHYPILAQTRTECDICDYLLVSCTRSGRVLEAHAPGTCSERLMVQQSMLSMSKISQICIKTEGNSPSLVTGRRSRTATLDPAVLHHCHSGS